MFINYSIITSAKSFFLLVLEKSTFEVQKTSTCASSLSIFSRNLSVEGVGFAGCKFLSKGGINYIYSGRARGGQFSGLVSP